jgi:hypothetical protein
MPNFVANGLGTFTNVVNTAGFYTVRSKSSLPTITAGGVPSGLVSTIQKNGSTVLASLAGASGVSASGISCAVGDSLSVVYSSALSTDAFPFINEIKSTISIFLGA